MVSGDFQTLHLILKAVNPKVLGIRKVTSFGVYGKMISAVGKESTRAK
jgi:hypothetical protein